MAQLQYCSSHCTVVRQLSQQKCL